MVVKCRRCGLLENRMGRPGFTEGLCQGCQTLIAAARSRFSVPENAPKGGKP